MYCTKCNLLALVYATKSHLSRQHVVSDILYPMHKLFSFAGFFLLLSLYLMLPFPTLAQEGLEVTGQQPVKPQER
jgi:hypothetical protein